MKFNMTALIHIQSMIAIGVVLIPMTYATPSHADSDPETDSRCAIFTMVADKALIDVSQGKGALTSFRYANDLATTMDLPLAYRKDMLDIATTIHYDFPEQPNQENLEKLYGVVDSMCKDNYLGEWEEETSPFE